MTQAIVERRFVSPMSVCGDKCCLRKKNLGKNETNCCRLYFRNGPLVANAFVKCIVLKYLNLFILIYCDDCNEEFLVPYSQASVALLCIPCILLRLVGSLPLQVALRTRPNVRRLLVGLTPRLSSR